MCLFTVSKTFNPPLDEYREGWKVFEFTIKDMLKSEIWDDGPLLANVEHEATHGVIVADTGEPYSTGFHAFTTYEDAERWRWNNTPIRKVKIRGIVAEGIQNDLHVVVARYMTILSDNPNESR